jgi:riboflavin kinase / FMN adenylyltransferase
MEFLTGQDPLPDSLAGASLALGNFDGFHLGHQQVAGAAARIANRFGRPLGVLTFDPHPARFFQADKQAFGLMDLQTKARALAEFGVDLLVVLPFTAELARLSADAFVKEMLVGRLRVGHIAAGYDFTFGKGRSGSATQLTALGADLSFGVDIVPAHHAGGETGPVISSTLIRRHLESGAPDAAAALMGRWWSIRGAVAGGDQRGRTIGFPTANIALGAYMRPTLGVYAVRARIGGAPDWIGGVANFGRRPTFDKTDELLEVHLFDFSGDLYGQTLEVEFVSFLRPEQKFAGLDALKAQIAADSLAARAVLASPAGAPNRFQALTRHNFV